ncbi:MAG: GyrI-like domain-containing protein [Phycisphaerae bacterium]|nr:GyrI-like domain-containing protein [Phycisphaerae bacterium]
MASDEKIDLYKQHKDQYKAAKKPVLLTAEEAMYLAIDGRGGPGGDEFTDKIGALYGMAYTIKMTRKFSGQQDYVVCKLEALWWLDDDKHDFESTPRDNWNWKLMIRTPGIVKQEELEKAASVLIEKGKSPAVREVRLEGISEGPCVQMLHVGPYDKEGETVEVMKGFAEEQGLEFHGRHHEIYLSDPRRVPPERLKTILRRPVRPRPD